LSANKDRMRDAEAQQATKEIPSGLGHFYGRK
jgi:hypothetical protein